MEALLSFSSHDKSTSSLPQPVITHLPLFMVLGSSKGGTKAAIVQPDHVYAAILCNGLHFPPYYTVKSISIWTVTQ